MKTIKPTPSLIKQIVALFKGLLDKRTPWVPKFTGIIILLYIILPFDFVTDFLPFLGWLDDAAIAAIGIFIITKLVPEEVQKDYL
jgi:uncharacterized membrane protein YkvA (DUF1232 family)